jgi:predicted CxxxxCH...CXXCH cytochrome family protein
MPATLVAEDPPLLQMGFSLFTSNATYDGHALNPPYSYEGTNSTAITAGGTKTCSNIYCHSNGTSVATGVVGENSSPPWNAAGPFACNICHGYPPSYAQDQPKSNSHAFHNFFGCNTCHYATTTGGDTITNFTNHANQSYNVIHDPNVLYGGPLSFNYSFDPGGGLCSNVTCHGAVPNQKYWGGVELTAGVGWISGPACFEVQFTGSLNGTPPQSFSWNYGDGQTGEGEHVSHLYASAGEYDVQLSAIDANMHRAETLAHVLVQGGNLLPVPDRTVTVSGYTVTVTDYSTDPDYNTCGHSGPGAVRVQWGTAVAPDTEISADLTDTRPTMGRTVSYTYATSGTYTLKHAVRDNYPSGYIYSNNIAVTVPTTVSVKGTVTRSNGTTLIYGASLTLRSATKSYIATTKTDGTFTFTNVQPGTYNITAIKAGYTFSNPAVTGIAVTTENVTGINFSSITP